MYSTCIFCHADLGSNESIEHFPVGRRLAFDAARGRLWVVCRGCERWNLTPLEERWEAIEECERLFAATRLRVSTDNIGMARLREGLELVRIGSALRPEMAAWRYGDQFGRRRRKHLAYTGAGVAVAAGLVILGPATGIIAGSSWGVWNIASTIHNVYQQRRVRARLGLPGVDEPVAIRRKQLKDVSVVQAGETWGLRIPYERPVAQPLLLPGGHTLKLFPLQTGPDMSALVTGEAALRAASKILPAINASGASRAEVDSAVALIGRVSEPTELFARYAARSFERRQRRTRDSSEPGLPLSGMAKEIRLALEMATHEDSERRALEGELARLEDDWREAEEIAAIADNLFVPDEMRRRLAELKDAGRGPTG